MQFEAGVVLPSEWTDVTTPIGKATQIYYRALVANGITDLRVTLDQFGKSITIPAEEAVGVNHT